ncbi:MAG TPA: S41 family peptidase [Gemmatimonadales bacterium]|jgi:carboxyl-terminal processing protease|nr:S41 family peptidase [Gemmatimonadales bacterium]
MRPKTRRWLLVVSLSGLFVVAASGWVVRPELLRALRGEPSADIALIESVLAVIRQHYADSLGERDLRLRAVEGILRNLPDNYSALLADGELKGYRELLEGTSGDVGLRLLDGPLGLSVGEVLPGSPGALRGIRPGDRLLTIEDAPTLGWSSLRGEQALGGEPGSSVRLRLRHPGSTVVDVVVLRRERAQRLAPETRILGPGVGYVRLSNLSRGSAATVSATLTEMVQQGAEAVVLDLRNNPGGLLEEATTLLDRFLEAGSTIGVVQGRGAVRDRRVLAEQRQRWPGLKVVVLVNAGTASAAEIIAAGLKENRRGIVLGEHTFGKGTVQSTVRLGPKLAVRISTARWITPAGNSLDRSAHDRGGVEPNLVVPPWRPRPADLALAHVLGSTADPFRQVLEQAVLRGEWSPGAQHDSLPIAPRDYRKLARRVREAGFALSTQQLIEAQGLLRQEYAVIVMAPGALRAKARLAEPQLPDVQLLAALRLLQKESPTVDGMR